MSAPDEQLLALVAAALDRFGPSLTLRYQTDAPPHGARCKIVFPQPPTSPPQESQT